MNSNFTRRFNGRQGLSAVVICLLLTAIRATASGPTTFCKGDVFASTAFLANNNLVNDYQGEAISYFSHRDNIHAYFTETGVVYRMQERKPRDLKPEAVADDDDLPITTKQSIVKVSWLG